MLALESLSAATCSCTRQSAPHVCSHPYRVHVAAVVLQHTPPLLLTQATLYEARAASSGTTVLVYALGYSHGNPAR
jgi:hypothetical protein